MLKDKVEVFFDPILIGNPKSFDYNVGVMIRVNDTFLDKPPDYIWILLQITIPSGFRGFRVN